MTDTPLGLVSIKYTNKADEYIVANITFNARDKNLMQYFFTKTYSASWTRADENSWISWFNLAKGIVKTHHLV